MRKKAFTLVEVLIVMVSVSVLIVMLIPAISSPVTNSHTTKAKAEINAISLAVNNIGLKNPSFNIDTGLLASYINAELAIDMRFVVAANGSLKSKALDPWGSEYIITTSFPENTNGEVTITSAGVDQTLGTSDDLVATVRYTTEDNLQRLVVTNPE